MRKKSSSGGTETEVSCAHLKKPRRLHATLIIPADVDKKNYRCRGLLQRVVAVVTNYRWLELTVIHTIQQVRLLL